MQQIVNSGGGGGAGLVQIMAYVILCYHGVTLIHTSRQMGTLCHYPGLAIACHTDSANSAGYEHQTII